MRQKDVATLAQRVHGQDHPMRGVAGVLNIIRRKPSFDLRNPQVFNQFLGFFQRFFRPTGMRLGDPGRFAPRGSCQDVEGSKTRSRSQPLQPACRFAARRAYRSGGVAPAAGGRDQKDQGYWRSRLPLQAVIEKPPSMSWTPPVRLRASGEARKAHIAPTSSIVAN